MIDAIQIVHICFTALTVLGGLVLGYFKLKDKRADRSEDKLSKFMTSVDAKIEKHIVADGVTHGELGNKLDKLNDAYVKQETGLAALCERSKATKEAVDRLSDKVDQMMEHK